MASRSPTKPRRSLLIVLGFIGLAMGAIYAAAELAPVDWDPSGVIGVGVEDTIRVGYTERAFGRQIPLTETVGHDGRFFFIQAMDPLLLEPASHAAFLDRPSYRAQRMLYPALAGAAGMGEPESIAWAMIAVNVAAFAVGTVGTGRLAAAFGLSPFWGLAFAANPGVRFELDIAGAGVVAFAAVIWGLVFVREERFRRAALAFTLAVLAREVMIIAVVGAALIKGIDRRKDRLLIVAAPTVAGALWWVYVQMRVGDIPSEATVQEIGLPFQGFVGAFRLWVQEPGLDMVFGFTYLMLSILMIVRAVRRQTLLELPAAGFGVLAMLLTRQVWYQHFDISRAVSPLLTLFLLSLAVSIFARPSSRSGGLPGRKQESVVE